jgi:hypothetical protein
VELSTTPYEEYLAQSIKEEKQRLDSLYDEFAHSNTIRKQLVKRKIAEVMQNIELLSDHLAKYRYGLAWLREPTKERDEKAEHLPALSKEEVEKAPATTGKAPAPQPAARPVIGRPVIGKPTTAAGQTPPASASQAPSPPRPSVGTPVGPAATTKPAESAQRPAAS